MATLIMTKYIFQTFINLNINKWATNAKKHFFYMLPFVYWMDFYLIFP